MIPVGKQGVFYEEVEFELGLEGQVSMDMRAGGRWASVGDPKEEQKPRATQAWSRPGPERSWRTVIGENGGDMG